MHRLNKSALRAVTAGWLPVLCVISGVSLNLHCSSDGDPGPTPVEQCETLPTDVYHDRIEPLLVDANPKTCNQCHLSGVDLTVFVRSSPCETMACLVDQGLVNLKAPTQSKILSWISRASPESELITESVIQAEHDGFLQWIEASAQCPSACAGATCGPATSAPTCEATNAPRELPPDFLDEVGCDDASIERLFEKDVYNWRGRCFPCHFSDQTKADPDAPRWIRAEGNCALASLQTMRRVIASGYLNLAEPTQSLLLLKPLAEDAGGVEHGGHDKFSDTEDPAYQSFLHFIQHYAKCQSY